MLIISIQLLIECFYNKFPHSLQMKGVLAKSTLGFCFNPCTRMHKDLFLLIHRMNAGLTNWMNEYMCVHWKTIESLCNQNEKSVVITTRDDSTC